MSRSVGTGSPVFFHCGAWRRESYRNRGRGNEHVVELTGRKKPYRKKRHSLALRSSDTSREYRCSCGHVGWSNHMDLERMEERNAADANAT